LVLSRLILLFVNALVQLEVAGESSIVIVISSPRP